MPSRPLTLTVQALGVATAVWPPRGSGPEPACRWHGPAACSSTGWRRPRAKWCTTTSRCSWPLSPCWSHGRGTRGRWTASAANAPAPPGASYGWPVRTAMVVVTGAYFFSGFNKLMFSGLAWATGSNLRWVSLRGQRRTGPARPSGRPHRRPPVAGARAGRGHDRYRGGIPAGPVLAPARMDIRPGSRGTACRHLGDDASGLLRVGRDRHRRFRPVAGRGRQASCARAEPTGQESQSAASLAWYVRIRSAPARRMPVRISRIAARSSIQPFAAAAFTMAYSPLTL